MNLHSARTKEANGCRKLFQKEVGQMTEENIKEFSEQRRLYIDQVEIGSYHIDNRWVAPYNPWFKKFNAHINVEDAQQLKVLSICTYIGIRDMIQLSFDFKKMMFCMMMKF